MPSLVTHHIFSDMVYEKLDNKIKKTFQEEKLIYNTFSQSHDYLFYSFNKEIKSLGHKAHHEKSQEYLYTIVKGIKLNDLQYNKQCLAYLYGAITHYCLDTICHPYIFYKTGTYHKNKETEKYHGKHTLIEKELDAIYYEKTYNKKYYKANLNKEIIKNPILNKELITFIDTVYHLVFNKDDIGKRYVECIKDIKIINTFAVQDRLGIKRNICRPLKKTRPLSYYSNHIKNPDLNWINKEHKTWNHPCNKEQTYNDSFDDLMKKALDKSIDIINQCHKVIFEKEDIETLKDYILDLDYATGYLIKDNKTMKYFEY